MKQTAYQAFAYAVKTGNLEAVENLIANHADVNAINHVKYKQTGQSVLFLACWHNQVEIVEQLIKAGALVNRPDKRGWTPLTIAAYHGYENLVQLLLQYNADINQKDSVKIIQFGKRPAERAKNEALRRMIEGNAPRERKIRALSARSSHSRSVQSIMSSQEGRKGNLKGDLEEFVKERIQEIGVSVAQNSLRLVERQLQLEMKEMEQGLYENLNREIEKAVKGVKVKAKTLQPTVQGTKVTSILKAQKQVEKQMQDVVQKKYDQRNVSTNMRQNLMQYADKILETYNGMLQKTCQDYIGQAISEFVQRTQKAASNSIRHEIHHISRQIEEQSVGQTSVKLNEIVQNRPLKTSERISEPNSPSSPP